jgi:hypothetical protein
MFKDSGWRKKLKVSIQIHPHLHDVIFHTKVKRVTFISTELSALNRDENNLIEIVKSGKSFTK